MCPVDCAICADPVCRQEGCKETGEIMLEVCDWCGDPFTPNDCLAVCVTCSGKRNHEMRVPAHRGGWVK